MGPVWTILCVGYSAFQLFDVLKYSYFNVLKDSFYFNALDPQLVAEVSRALGGVTIVHKGSTDYISNGKFTEECSADGCHRRFDK